MKKLLTIPLTLLVLIVLSVKTNSSYSQAPVLRNIVQVGGAISYTPDLISTRDGNFLLAVVKEKEIGNDFIEVRKFDSFGNTIWKVFLEDESSFSNFDSPILAEISSGYCVGFGRFSQIPIKKLNKSDGTTVVSGVLNSHNIESGRSKQFATYESNNLITIGLNSLLIYDGDFNLIQEVDVTNFIPGDSEFFGAQLRINSDNDIFLVGYVKKGFDENIDCFSGGEIHVGQHNLYILKMRSSLTFLDYEEIYYASNDILRFSLNGETPYNLIPYNKSVAISNNGEVLLAISDISNANLPCSSSPVAPIHKFNSDLNIDPTWNSNPTNFGTYTGFDDIGFLAYDDFEGKPLVVSANALVEIRDDGTKGWETDFIGEGGVGFGSQTERIVSNGNGLYVTLQRDFQFFEGSPDFLSIAFLEAPVQVTGDLIVSNIQVTPDSAPWGSQVAITGRVRNIGTEDASTSTLKVFASSDNSYDNNDIEVLSLPINAIESGNSETFNSWITIPNTGVIGSNNLLFKADFNNQIQESDELNNTLITSFNISQGVTCNDDLENNNTISTATELGAISSFNGQLCLTKQDSDWFTFTFLGEPFYFRVNGFNDFVEGSYSLDLSLNGNTLTIETNEISGKTDTKLLLIDSDMSTSLAENDDKDAIGWPFSRIVYDFNVSEVINLSISNFVLSNNSVQAGESISTSLLINNEGNVSSPNVNLTYYLSSDNNLSTDDLVLENKLMSGLSEGNNVNVNTQLEIPQSIESGNIYIIASIDSDNELQENDENDNISSQGLEVTSIVYNITTNVNPLNSGSVLGSGAYSNGQTAALTATPFSGYNFISWTNSSGVVIGTDLSLNFTVNSDALITANFEQAIYSISVTSSNIAQGTVSGDGNYLGGVEAKIKAIPSNGFDFLNWTENNIIVSSSEEYLFVVSSDRNLLANFEELSTATYEINSASINIYPNPVIDNIYIDITGEVNYIVSIYNVVGELVKRIPNVSEISIHSLPQGIYFLEVKDIKTNQTIVERIIIGR